ncbi:MAG: tRNA lysidine(34) synthetase TilS [Sinobacteraceae bacterium]|nr:tRNA lysidine(34) synthetase TilS [Nevskiaceae bacterium]
MRLQAALEGPLETVSVRGLCIALSGGADSVALLRALQQLRRRSARWRRLTIRAVHINHQLRPAARSWEQQCRRLCTALEVPLIVRRVRVPQGPGRSLEAEARRVRYAALTHALLPGELLLTAHHQDDQLETFLLQLLRGAGVAGLAAMGECTRLGERWLLRPLLAEPRSELETYARASGVSWVDDDSNVDERFDRNYLRHRVLPALRERWPAVATVVARSAAHLGEAQQLLREQAQADLERVAPQGPVELSALRSLSVIRQRNALREWLREADLPLPDRVHLERIRCELPAARADAQPFVRWGSVEVRRFRGALYALGQPPEDVREGEWHWQRGRPYVLGETRGVLRLRRDPEGELDARRLPAVLSVTPRAEGESLRPYSGEPDLGEPGRSVGPRLSVKELFRVAAVLPWERRHWPLLRAGDASGPIVAVVNLAIDAAYRAKPGRTAAKDRLRLVWESAPLMRALR